MKSRKLHMRMLRALALALLSASLVVGCSGGNDGKNGTDGTEGTAGVPGAAGINCWDLNENGLPDPATEDLNGDGIVDVLDCRAPDGAYDPVSLHKGYFTENTYTGTSQCLNCHGKIGDDVMTTAHWKWQGPVTEMVGFEGQVHGKKDLINNFCQAVPSNEGRCSQCHISYGWTDKSFDFANAKNIDCLACHDQSGTYKKVAAPGGAPDPSVDLQKVAQSVGLNGGVPPRAACIICHALPGGDDNVKHGDLSRRMALQPPADPNADVSTYLHRSEDVHMGVDPLATGTQKKGGNMTCVACHQVKKDAEGDVLSHGIGGFMFHSNDEGVMKECSDCHGSVAGIHAGTSAQNIVASHPRLACQTCHIPAVARKVSTYTDWRWSKAGYATAADAGCPTEPVGTGNRPTYNKLKGCFVWATNVRPELRFYNGKWNRVVMGFNDKYTSLPMDLASPTATYRDADAMIYPFKKMTGDQAFDKNNKTVLVPHLWGTVTGPNPYWAKFDWTLALQEGADYSPAYNGGQQIYTGEHEFLETVMLLKVDHEVAPREQALGINNQCGDCHLGTQIDWAALGWTEDPARGGEQTLP